MLGVEKRIRAEYGDVEASREQFDPKDDPGDAWHMSRISLALGILALVVAGILYVAMDLKVSGAKAEIEEGIGEAVAKNSAMVQAFDQRLAALESMPGKVRAIIMSSEAAELSMRAEKLGAAAFTDEQKQLAQDIKELTEKLQQSIMK